MGMIFGGWQLSGIATFQGGRPFNVNLNTGVNNGAPSWPNRIGVGELDDPDRALWFDPTAFVAPPANTYGDVGRGVLYSPGQKNIDVSLTRRFGFFGDVEPDGAPRRVQPDQHAVLRLPERDIGSPTVGQITTTERRQPHPAARVQARLLGRGFGKPRLAGDLSGGRSRAFFFAAGWCNVRPNPPVSRSERTLP